MGVDWQVESEDVLVELPALECSSPFTSLTHVRRPGTDSSLVMSGDPGSLSAEPPTVKHSLDRVLFKSVPSFHHPLPPSLPLPRSPQPDLTFAVSSALGPASFRIDGRKSTTSTVNLPFYRHLPPPASLCVSPVNSRLLLPAAFLAFLPDPLFCSRSRQPSPHASSSRYSASSDAILPALTQMWYALGYWRSLDMTLLPQSLRHMSSAPSLRGRQPAVLALKRREDGKYWIEDERPKPLQPVRPPLLAFCLEDAVLTPSELLRTFDRMPRLLERFRSTSFPVLQSLQRRQ